MFFAVGKREDGTLARMAPAHLSMGVNRVSQLLRSGESSITLLG